MHSVYKINPVFWRILLRVFVLVYSHRLHVRQYCMYIGRDHTSFTRRSVSYTSIWRCRSVRTCYLHNNTTPRKFCLLQFRFVSHADKNMFSSEVNGQGSPDQITIIPFRLYSRIPTTFIYLLSIEQCSQYASAYTVIRMENKQQLN